MISQRGYFLMPVLLNLIDRHDGMRKRKHRCISNPPPPPLLFFFIIFFFFLLSLLCLLLPSTFP